MGLFSFITAPVSAVVKGITGVVSAGKTKAAAKINADTAAKQRAHELKMANLAAARLQSEQAQKSKNIMIVAVIAGVILLLFFMRGKRK